MAREHIVKSYDADLKGLKASIARMGGTVDEQITGAMDALMKRNAEEARAVVQADDALDSMELQIEQQAISTLALRQPLAEDLRYVLAALKIASVLERIGDFAANIAKRSTVLVRHTPQLRVQATLPEMARQVRSLTQQAIDAYLDDDAEKAHEVWLADKRIDELYTSLFRELLTYMMEDPRAITPCTHFLFIAKNLERMGDHATNIAEMVHYMVTGTTIPETRPKSDDTSYAVVAPPTGRQEGPESGEGSESGAESKGDDTDKNEI